MKPLVFVAIGVLLALAAFAILAWVLGQADDDRVTQRDTPPSGYLQASA